MHPITNMGEKSSILFRHLTIENSFKQCELLVCKGVQMYRYYMPLELSEVYVHISNPSPLLQPLRLFALL